ncbi:methyltransferase-like protein 25B [Dermacentor andersoni]|uniref:methyltransferase-like protein 25B n=1 Tax=Dermacentor andersoni TaxID=34620 RepID=UPI002417EF64|nr:methyltransferase-like protein 25B [Dermacentor andersoni]
MEKTEYLSSCAQFLSEFSWICNSRMTDLLIAGTLDAVPAEWVNHLDKLSGEELGKVPFGLIKSDWPSSLQSFVSRAVELGEARFLEPPSELVAKKTVLPPAWRQGLTPKKQLELEWLATLVADTCIAVQCGRVLDIGAGLGHLARVLHHRYGFTVLGIDCDASYLLKAQEHLRHFDCAENVHYFTLQVDDSAATVEKLRHLLRNCPDHSPCACGEEYKFVKELTTKNRYVLVSLHGCGQLSPGLMRLFHAMPELEALVCIGCCYHKAAQLHNYFPLSRELTSLGDRWLSPGTQYQGLRLACQELRDSWQPDREPCHLLFRALLEVACQKYGLPWKKSRRHMARHSLMSSWDAYREHVMQDVHCQTSERDMWCGILNQLHARHQHQLSAVRTLTLLRQLLQPCWEGMVLGDRACWSGAQLAAAFPSAGSSPRNIALLLARQPPPH